MRKPVPVELYQPTRVCKIDSRAVASMAWTATSACGLQGARDARRGLCSKEPPPPPPTAYRRLRARREAHRGLSKSRARTRPHVGQREAKPINGAARCPRGTREHRAGLSSLERFPRSPQAKHLPIWGARKLPQGCPSQRHRGAGLHRHELPRACPASSASCPNAIAAEQRHDGPPAAPILDGPRRRRPRIQQQFRPR